MVVTDVAGGLSIYFHPEALPAFSEIAQKLPSTSFIPDNLFPSISARHDVMDGTGKFNPRKSCHSSLQSRQSHKPTADPFGMLAMACRRFELRAALSLISKSFSAPQSPPSEFTR